MEHFVSPVRTDGELLLEGAEPELVAVGDPVDAGFTGAVKDSEGSHVPLKDLAGNFLGAQADANEAAPNITSGPESLIFIQLAW